MPQSPSPRGAGAPLGSGLPAQWQRKEIQERQNPLVPPTPFLSPLGREQILRVFSSFFLLSHKEFHCSFTSTSIQTERKTGKRFCASSPVPTQQLGASPACSSQCHPCQDTRECQQNLFSSGKTQQFSEI